MADSNYKELSDEALSKKKRGFELIMGKFEGKNEKIVAKAKSELATIEAEIESRLSGDVKKEAKKAVETQKKVDPALKKKLEEEDALTGEKEGERKAGEDAPEAKKAPAAKKPAKKEEKKEEEPKPEKKKKIGRPKGAKGKKKAKAKKSTKKKAKVSDKKPEVDKKVEVKKIAPKKVEVKAERKYKIGDMWSEDFDYDGMLKKGLEADVSWGEKKLSQLFDSYEDVNYHSIGSPLWEAVVALKDKKEDEAKKHIASFHSAIKKEMGIVEKEVKKAEPKAKDEKPKPTPPPPAPKSFVLKIDGEEYKFSDLESKESCEKAINAVKARRAEQVKHKEAQAEGIEKAKTITVTARISDSFASIAKKAVAEIPEAKIKNHPEDIKNELDAVEKAFTTLFDKLEILMDRKISADERKQVMSIFTKFETKVDKAETKKEKATATKRVEKKEEGGIIDSGDDNSWSYASLW